MTRRRALLLLLAAGLACGRGPLDDHWVVIEAARLAPEGVEATWREHGAEDRVWLRIHSSQAPWTRAVVHGERDGPIAAWLLEGPPAALLLLHAASHRSAFRRHVLPSRLAALDVVSQGTRLALVFAADALPETARSARLTELRAVDAARLVAVAEALGAWDVLASGHVPLRDDGRPFLPRFAPRAPGDWSDLRGSALEGFLPEALAARIAGDPALREASYAELRELAEALPELAAAVAKLADALPERVPRDGVDALLTLLAESTEAYASYLDSIWLEQVVTLLSPDVAEIVLYVHTLVPVRVEGFTAAVPRRLTLLEKDAISGLRLRDAETGRAVAARAQRQRVILPARRAVAPVASGAYRFRSTRLRWLLEGLDGSEPLRLHLLDNLRPVVRRNGSDAPVDPSHIRHLAAVADPRFSAAQDEDAETFARALPDRLRGDGARLTPDGLTLRAGTYELRGDLILPSGAGLRLEAGVELRIQPRRSILVRGPLHIDGTAEQPVRILGTSEAPWGVLAAQGRDVGAPGGRPATRIRHLELAGGSEDEIRGAYYSGQLSVYHQDLRLDHATLRRSHADDSLNVKFGSVDIRDAVFLESAADAVDLDWVEGSVRRSRFEGMGPGGDALDLSGSRLVVEDSVFSRAGDKCISVGEKASVAVRGALLRGCAIGLASKDLSTTEIRDSIFLDNERDLAAYRKKPVFGGGRIAGERLVFAGSRQGALRDPLSEIEVRGAVLIGSDDGDIDLSDAARLDPGGETSRVLAPLAEATDFSSETFERVWRALR